MHSPLKLEISYALMALWFPYVGYLVMAVFMGSRMSPSIVLTKGSVLKMENLSLEAYSPRICCSISSPYTSPGIPRFSCLCKET